MTKRIAIIGSGMAGLTAGWLCRQAGHEVTIIENHPQRGMDAHTVIIEEQGEAGYVDVRLRVLNTHAWPTVLELCRKVGVDTFPVDTPVSCSWLGGPVWFRSSKLRLGSKEIPWAGTRFLLRKEPYRLLFGFLRLSNALHGLNDPKQTILEFAEWHRPAPIFWKGLVLPLLTTICTCSEETLNNWPAKQLLELLNWIVFGKTLLRLCGGTRALVEKLGEGLVWQSGTRIERIENQVQGIFLFADDLDFGPFDQVICAVQANQIDFLPQNWSRERKLLNSFSYDSGTLWVHRDLRFMPATREDWSPLHFQIDKGFRQSMFTVWVNPIEPRISKAEPVFQTWNPLFEPKSKTVLSSVPLQRAVVGNQNASLLLDLERMHAEVGRRVFFCGSYATTGVPLLESAVSSAVQAVRSFGIEPPWGKQNESSAHTKFQPVTSPDLAA